jgi:hypothetical protein
MLSTQFTSLPPEVTHEILSYLPISSLLAFSETSHSSHSIALSAFNTLHIGIYHTKIASLISSISRSTSTDSKPSTHNVPIILCKREARDKHQIIRSQTSKLVDIISRHAPTLRSLEVSAWALEQDLADVLVTMPNLRTLAVRLDHPTVRHARVPKSFWDVSPLSPVWNTLSDQRKNGRAPFGRLESLTLERSGITDHQLLQLLQRNPRIKELKLQKCLTITDEFFEALANSPMAKTLEKLSFTRSGTCEIDERILEHLAELTNLKVWSSLPSVLNSIQSC